MEITKEYLRKGYGKMSERELYDQISFTLTEWEHPEESMISDDALIEDMYNLLVETQSRMAEKLDLCD